MAGRLHDLFVYAFVVIFAACMRDDSGELNIDNMVVEKECDESLIKYQATNKESQKEIVTVGISIGTAMLQLGASNSESNSNTVLKDIETLSKLDDSEFDQRWDAAMQKINPSATTSSQVTGTDKCPQLLADYRKKKKADQKEVAIAGLSIGGTLLSLGGTQAVAATSDILGGLSSLASLGDSDFDAKWEAAIEKLKHPSAHDVASATGKVFSVTFLVGGACLLLDIGFLGGIPVTSVMFGSAIGGAAAAAGGIMAMQLENKEFAKELIRNGCFATATAGGFLDMHPENQKLLKELIKKGCFDDLEATTCSEDGQDEHTA